MQMTLLRRQDFGEDALEIAATRLALLESNLMFSS